MTRRTIVIAITFLIVPALLLAQGTSPIKVTGISVSPAAVAPGTNVTISVTLKNMNTTASYGCTGGAISVYVFKDAPYLAANQVFTATQTVSAMGPSETRTVAVGTHWTVPSGDVGSYHVVAWSPMCAPDEFGQTAQLTLRKSCTYSATPLIFSRQKLPITIQPHP